MRNKIAADATIMQDVAMGENVTIAKGALIYPNVTIEDNVSIGAYCVIGEPTSEYYSGSDHRFQATRIGKGSVIRSHTVIYEGVEVGDAFQTGHHVTIREKSVIGHNCSVGTLSDLQGFLRVGNYVRLHSNVHIGQLTVIDDFVWIYPFVVTTNDPYPPMGNLEGVRVCQYAQIAAGSIILPGKMIGENSLVGAGSVVTKDVPAETLVVGVPAKAVCDVKTIKDKKGNPVYPWKEYLEQFRSYPWQIIEGNGLKDEHS